MPQTIELRKSTQRPDKKYVATIGNKNIYFGQAGASDMTQHHSEQRKQNYISRHQKRENWGKSGLETSGWWSKNLLWNKPTLRGSIRDANKRFDLHIVYKS